MPNVKESLMTRILKPFTNWLNKVSSGHVVLLGILGAVTFVIVGMLAMSFLVSWAWNLVISPLFHVMKIDIWGGFAVIIIVSLLKGIIVR